MVSNPHCKAARCAAYDNGIGKRFFQIPDETKAQVLSIIGGIACADHADDVAPVQVCRTLIEKDKRSVAAFP